MSIVINMVYIIYIFLIFLIFWYTVYTIYLQLIPGAFYYPSAEKNIQNIIKLAKPKTKDIFIDLGSGDGRIVLASAKLGINSIGYELNPTLVHQSRQIIKKLNLSHLAKIKFKNFWQADFNHADIIYVYQFPKYIKKLEKILKKTNHPLTVISNQYPFHHQKPYLIKDRIYFYKFL